MCEMYSRYSRLCEVLIELILQREVLIRLSKLPSLFMARLGA